MLSHTLVKMVHRCLWCSVMSFEKDKLVNHTASTEGQVAEDSAHKAMEDSAWVSEDLKDAILAIFGMSSRWTRSWNYHFRRSSLKNTLALWRVGVRSSCVDDSIQALWLGWAFCCYHTGTRSHWAFSLCGEVNFFGSRSFWRGSSFLSWKACLTAWSFAGVRYQNFNCSGGPDFSMWWKIPCFAWEPRGLASSLWRF